MHSFQEGSCFPIQEVIGETNSSRFLLFPTMYKSTHLRSIIHITHSEINYFL